MAAAALAAPPAGDAQRGRALLLQRHDTGCILCHVVPGIGAGGDLGPSLDGAGQRLGPAALRERIGDARQRNPQTIMPPYRSTDGLHNVAPVYAGRTVLSEQGLEDIVAYLMNPTLPDRPPAAPVAAQGADAPR